MTFYDLTRPIEDGMPHFPGDPAPRVVPVHGTPPWRVTAVELGTHTGTHIDAPSHCIPGARPIDAFPAASFVRPGTVAVLAGLGEDEPIEPERLEPSLARMRPGEVVVIATGWEHAWGAPRYFRHPYLSQEAAMLLVDAGIAIVGVDTPSVDSTVRGTSAAHETLLTAGVLIVENLCGLDALAPGQRYVFCFLPLPVRGGDGAPVRAVAWTVDTAFV